MSFVGSFGRGVERNVIVYGRLSRSAYLKYKVLGRSVGGPKWIFLPASTRIHFLNVLAKKTLDAKARALMRPFPMKTLSPDGKNGSLEPQRLRCVHL
jgi:hypothetical protein